MAEQGRTVRVTGLPTDIDDDRLKDKLFIHFLRPSHGGGEIDTVTIVKATPASALITFEDSGVAQRIIQRSRHILKVDGKKYELTATEHRESLDPDQVILSLSATVDYRQLPGGVMALTNLRKSHPDVQINYMDSEECCTLGGAFSKVQAALAQLLGQPGGLELAGNKDSAQSASSGPESVQTAQKPRESEDRSRKHNKPREQREKNLTDKPSDEYKSSSNRDLTSGSYGWEGIGQTDSAAIQLPTTAAEDFSLIVDADMFQYLEKHCRKEYQHILSQYGVEVVDMTNQGLTTLYLHASAAASERGREQERLKSARKAISRLYQENETKIRRAQIPKIILSPSGELQKAIEHLSVRLPKLLLNEDDQNICIIGSSSDVSDAKQFLLDHGKVRGKKESAANLRIPLYEPSQSTYLDEERIHFPPSSTLGSSDDGMYQMPESEEEERRTEGAKKYKLAARFKDTGLAALGSRPTDFVLRTNSSPGRQPHLGPMYGHDVLSETAGTTVEAVSRSQNTGGDILFKSDRYSLPSSASMQNKISLSSDLLDARPKNVTSPFSTTRATLSGSTAPAGSGSTLKRASSFSGRPQQKDQVMRQDDSGTPTVRSRGRSSSFSTQTGRDKQEVYNADLTVSNLTWQYIKEAYRTRVEDLTSDVQMKESRQEGTKGLTVTLRGANRSKVSSCQQDLQKLLDSVESDFFVQQLRLSDLGVTDAEDETLQACCSEVRSRFKKVTIQIYKKTLFLFGPKELCSQVGATLREVFSGNLVQTPEQHHLSSQATSMWNSPTSLQMNEDQKASLHFNRNSQVTLEGQTSKADGSGWTAEWKTTYGSDFGEKEVLNGSVSQSLARKDHVIKEKVKTKSTLEMDGQKPETYVNHSTTGNDASTKHLNGVGSVTTSTENERSVPATQTDSVEQKQAGLQNTSEESSSGQGGLGYLCVCGENGAPMTRTKCGATICSNCLDKVHANCRVCQEAERTPWGIQGKVSKSKLHISIPGHNKDGAIKITYSIPDGIQGDGHPSPGKPFQGGTFEAFLPDSEKTRKLLPRLEKAFRQGLTFTVTDKDARARVIWDCIPHKTSIQGGKSGNGYPDSTYLTRLSEVLTSHGIVESPAKSQK